MTFTRFLPIGFELDQCQLALANKLENIAISLEKKSTFKFWRKTHHKDGVYLYGGVGRGKTMLMQAFYHRLTVKKQMIHYQEFMQSIHKNIHKLSRESSDRIIHRLAMIYSKKLKVLCIDEFEIKDITDAMIMHKLFLELIKQKLFILVTSNTKPDNLYKDGLQRISFLPFIELINRNFEIMHLDNPHDYRFDQVGGVNNRIFYPITDKSTLEIKKIISDLTSNKYKSGSILVFGREISFKKMYKGILITDFNELFMRDLGYIDYVNICQQFKVIVLENVPIIDSDDTDLITRFINFIDNTYFYKILSFITLQAAPEKIYQSGKRIVEFQRTISRLHEMNSSLYLERLYD